MTGTGDLTPDPVAPVRTELSVVVCSIGRAPVAECVASVLASAASGRVAVEVIVVWQSLAPRPDLPDGVQVLPAFPIGLSYARNVGLRAASAPVVAFVDDEVADETWAGAVLGAFRDAPLGPSAVFGAVDPPIGDGTARPSRFGAEPRSFTDPSTPPWIVGTEGNMAFDRLALGAVGGFDHLFGIGSPGRSAEGPDLIVELLRSGLRIDFVPDAVVRHPSKTVLERRRSRFDYGYGMGKVVRRHHDPVLATKYAVSAAQSIGRGIRERDTQRLREACGSLRGFLAGAARAGPMVTPISLLELAPEAILGAVDGRDVEALGASYRARPHHRFRAGDRFVHLYIAPSAACSASPGTRRVIAEAEAEAEAVAGLPTLHAVAVDGDALWIVEDAMAGTPAPGGSPDGPWLTHAVAWSRRFAGMGHGPLAGSPGWPALQADVLAGAPPRYEAAVAEALDAIGGLPAVNAHGDFEPKNLLLQKGGSLGVVDWETVERDGLPGQDLLFLTAMASGGGPDAKRLRGLLGDGAKPIHLLDALEASGLTAALLPLALLVVLARWRHQEAVRLAFPGARPSARVFDELFRQLAPELVAGRGPSGPVIRS